ncbi:hypothetical protein ig2599ANME_1539 [groundwater metagenome]
MVISEIFPKPTVKQVIFQIKFPNLFYIESRIGDFQVKIMKEFPQSNLLYRKQLLLTDVGPESKLTNIPEDLDKEAVKKIWQFKSDKNLQLNVMSNSLDINSEYHKTYNLEGGDKFRDTIMFVLERFFETMPIPVINRIGLRYIDECPIPVKDNTTFRAYYNSSFPLDRFNLADTKEMQFHTVVNRGNYFLRYGEILQKTEKEYKLILDYDGFGENIAQQDYLTVTDDLHTIISEEYQATIKEPVYEYMRQPKES